MHNVTKLHKNSGSRLARSVAILVGVLVGFNANVFATDGAMPGCLEGLVFSLGIKGDIVPDDESTYANIYDEVTYSSDSPLVAESVSTFNPLADAAKYEQFGNPDAVCVTNAYVVAPAHPWTSNLTDCVYLPAPIRVHDNGDGTSTMNCYPQTVKFARSVPTGSNVTYHIRFRWDGNLREAYEQHLFENGMDDNNGGFAMRMWFSGSALENDESSAYVRYYVGSDATGDYEANIRRGEWRDFVVRMTWSEDCDGSGTPGTKVLVLHDKGNFYADKVRSTAFTSADLFVREKTCASPASELWPLSLGHRSSPVETWCDLPDGPGYAFRGAIAKIQIYDRALSEAEMISLFSQSDGATVSVGVENGSADEFGTEADAVDVYEPAVMPMCWMRKALTAEHPSLSVKFPVRVEEAGLNRVLRLSTVSDGIARSATATLSVNGAPVCSQAFATGGVVEFPIRGRKFTRDTDGNITLTLTRTGNLSGALGIDAVKVVGSWQIGLADGSCADWCFADDDKVSDPYALYRANAWGLVGVLGDATKMFNTLYGWRNDGEAIYYPEQTVAFYVSPEMARECDSSFIFKSEEVVPENATVDVYTNGALCASGFRLANDPIVEVDLPAGSLNGGINYVTVSNSTVSVFTEGDSGYPSFNPDFYRFEMSLPKSGMLLKIK